MPEQNWESISDFTAGIREVISPNYPPGALQATGTFRCHAIDGGGLAPLPRRSNNYFFEVTLPDGETYDLPDDEDLVSPIFLSGLTTRNPVFWPSQTKPGVDQNNTDILLGLEYFFTSGGVTKKRYEMWRFFRHYDVPGFAFPGDRTPVWRHEAPGTWDRTVRPKRMSFTHGRTNNADPLSAGPIATAFCIDGHAHFFPDDTNTTGESTRYLPGDIESDTANTGGLVLPDFLVGHQGRVVIWPLALPAAGYQTTFTNNEAFYWTDPNDWRTKPSLVEYFTMVVGWEQPTGYQVMHSMNADQLVLIKSRGGAVLIQGDLDGDVAAIRLPGVRSPGLSMCNGTMSPVGLIYPVDGSGLWLHAGGEGSEHLTPSMEGDFWRPPADDYYGHGFTSADSWGDWVVMPNNWLLDLETETPSLWRLDDPEDLILHHHSVDWRGRFLYATGDRMLNRGTPAIVEYDGYYDASSYQARLHPLQASLDSRLRITGLGIVAQGSGRIRVTARNADGGVEEVTFSSPDANDTAARYPWTQTRGANLTGTHVELTINAAADDQSQAAPRVHAVLYAVDPATTPTIRS